MATLNLDELFGETISSDKKDDKAIVMDFLQKIVKSGAVDVGVSKGAEEALDAFNRYCYGKEGEDATMNVDKEEDIGW